MIERNMYLNKLISSIGNGFPKVITGIKRYGKSYLLKSLFKDNLLNKYKENCNIIILELDYINNILYKILSNYIII